jgi:hypothetical protein
MVIFGLDAGVAKNMCKTDLRNVQYGMPLPSNTEMAQQRLVANDIDVIYANTAIHRRRKYMATALRYAK